MVLLSCASRSTRFRRPGELSGFSFVNGLAVLGGLYENHNVAPSQQRLYVEECMEVCAYIQLNTSCMVYRRTHIYIIYIYIHTHASIGTYMHACMHTHTHTCTYTYTYAHICVCIFGIQVRYLHTHICVCMCICIYIYMFV